MHRLHNKTQQEGSTQKEKFRCYQLKRNITQLVINAKIFQITEICYWFNIMNQTTSMAMNAKYKIDQTLLLLHNLPFSFHDLWLLLN